MSQKKETTKEKEKDKEQERETIINPIDKDKIAEKPSTLPYAHNVSSAPIKPTKEGVIRSKSVSAMEEQTDMQMGQIKKQIDLLAEQARELQDRRDLSAKIYSAKMSFKPEINHIYHLYLNEKDEYVLSMVAPGEWGRKSRFKEFVSTVRLLADHTWQVEKEEE